MSQTPKPPKKTAPLVGYCMSPDYRKMTMWYFGKRTRSRLVTVTLRAPKGVPRQQRYEECCKLLTLERIPLPAYIPNHREKKAATVSAHQTR